uniref:Mitogen-activated protein kinase kinase kinase n=1 Tax=Cajanus cajan TaxID=3821 RepID=A0A151RC17_CAJCA|nr:Mitogen-activated protein kinase kinase kinase [Cajanus cajan]
MMALRQQMDHSNHDMVNLLSTQMHNIMTPLYELINKIGDKLGDGSPSRALSANLNEMENPVGHGNFHQNVVRPNRNPNDNLDQMVERILNRHGFDVGRNERPYFVSAFPDYITQVELPRGIKVPKFSKFAGELTESTVEHIARYGVECGDLANNEYLKMKYFPSSLTKHAFTWFTTLPPNSIHTWVQLEGSFHEHFFIEETKVSIVDLMNIKRQSDEDPYSSFLARILAYVADRMANMAEEQYIGDGKNKPKLDCIFDDSPLGFERAANEEHKLESQDPLEEINIIAGDPESVTETWMSNVYSFGMVIWEIITGEAAYSAYSPVQAAVGIAACGLRPEIPKDCPQTLKSLMTKCWNNTPSKRPQFSEILAILLRPNNFNR